jgi:hypothetical protein
MKVNFTPESEYVPEWNGNRDLPDDEQIKMNLSVLSMGHILNLMDIMEQAGHSGQTDDQALDVATTKKLVEMAQEILPQYVKDFRGLEVDSGPIALEAISDYPQFMALIVEITFELINRSSPNEDDKGN